MPLDFKLVSGMGTGTAFIWAEKNGEIRHLGGSGIGGGTLGGLCHKLVGMPSTALATFSCCRAVSRTSASSLSTGRTTVPFSFPLIWTAISTLEVTVLLSS